ncbi:Dihydroorotase [Candidatus Lokiarchaeum ossiferum]|uniref:Dihydroorotase n=1 Tax=Candidatus Lokiarchaeum ossiferum TaxID=2951803 RepID=A0ABY6HYU8_9ARCH|nr:Dihydroorotase [Candidatus Lokiarchaeum sp. B-35]
MKLLYNAQIFTANKLMHGHLVIKEGKIDFIGKGHPSSEMLSSIGDPNSRIDCENALLLPGFIDAHVHFRDSKQAYKETLTTGSKGAIAGGVTTVLSMPNTDPPLSTFDALSEYKTMAASKSLFCNIGLYTTVKEGFSFEELKQISSLGVFGIKIYPGDQSQDVPLEWTPGWVNDADPEFFAESVPKTLKHFMNTYPNWTQLMLTAKQMNLPLIFHPEYPRDPKILQRMWDTGVAIASAEKAPNPNLFAHDVHHPIYTNELACVEMIATLLRKYFPNPKDAPHVHFVHVSHPDPVQVVKRVLLDHGYSASVEVSPHHALLHKSMSFPDENFAKVLVPLRAQKFQKAMYALIQKGDIHSIGTDHAPHTLEEKQQPFEVAPSGFPYIDFASRILLTEVFAERLTLKTVINYYATQPAKLFGIANKGEISVGFDADLVLMKEVDAYPIKGTEMLSKQKWTPWENHPITAQVQKVFLEGNLAYDNIHGLSSPFGKILIKN